MICRIRHIPATLPVHLSRLTICYLNKNKKLIIITVTKRIWLIIIYTRSSFSILSDFQFNAYHKTFTYQSMIFDFIQNGVGWFRRRCRRGVFDALFLHTGLTRFQSIKTDITAHLQRYVASASILCPIESMDGHTRHLCHATFTDFEMIWRRPTVDGFSVRSNPTARRRRNHRRSLQKWHDKGDETVHTLDGTEYNLNVDLSICDVGSESFYLAATILCVLRRLYKYIKDTGGVYKSQHYAA